MRVKMRRRYDPETGNAYKVGSCGTCGDWSDELAPTLTRYGPTDSCPVCRYCEDPRLLEPYLSARDEVGY